jgi:hypothetical protein
VRAIVKATAVLGMLQKNQSHINLVHTPRRAAMMPAGPGGGQPRRGEGLEQVNSWIALSGRLCCRVHVMNAFEVSFLFHRNQERAPRRPHSFKPFMASNRRPAGQLDGSGDLFATVPADRAFPAAVAELIGVTHMRTIRQYLLMTVVVCASPFAAHAQWATLETEHDWRLTIAGRPYGLVQQVSYVGARLGGTRMTTICLGSFAAKTRIPAAFVATMFLLPVAVLGCFVMTGLFRQKR